MVLITVLTYEAANACGALEQFLDVDPATATVTDIMRKIRESTQLHNPHIRVGMQLYTYVDYEPGNLINDAENDPLALTATLDELRLSGRLQFEEDRRGLHLKVLVDGCRTAEEASEFKLKRSWRTEIAALRKRERDLTARQAANATTTAVSDTKTQSKCVEVLGAPPQRLPTPRVPTRRADHHVRRIWPCSKGSFRIVFVSLLLLAVFGWYMYSGYAEKADAPRLSPIHQEAIRGQTDKMRALIKQYLTDSPNHKANDGEKKSQEMTTEAAISYTDSVKNSAKTLGMNLDEKPHDANSLHLAAKYGQTDTVRALIKEFGADVKARNKEGGVTPLHEASIHHHTETVRVLTELGADVKAKSTAGFSPLHVASMGGHTETVRALIKEFGADVNKKNKGGNTPLHDAASNGQIDIVRILIKELGADLKVKSNCTRRLSTATWVQFVPSSRSSV